MSNKIVQLEFFPSVPNKEDFQDMVVKSMRGLFARDTARKKEIERLLVRNMELEEVVFRMNNRIDRILEEKVCSG